MLNHVNHGKLSLKQLINFVCENPIKIFGIKNKSYIKKRYDADFTLVDMNKEIKIQNKDMRANVGGHPLMDLFSKDPVATIINGKIKMLNGKY